MTRLFLSGCLILAAVGCGEVRPTDSGTRDGTDGQVGDDVLTCGEGLLECSGQCIDPLRDREFCGAQLDCAGLNTGATCEADAVCIAGGCSTDLPTRPEPLACSNCSFEQGNLSGWMVRDILNASFPIAVRGAGEYFTGFFNSVPTDGAFSVVTGFDGTGPGVITLSQVIDLPAGVTASLTFDYQAAWDMVNYGPSLEDRAFWVIVSTPDGAPLSAEKLLDAPAATEVTDTGVIPGTVNLTPFAGQQVLIEFLWDVPEDHTGPGLFQLDNVQIIAR